MTSRIHTMLLGERALCSDGHGTCLCSAARRRRPAAAAWGSWKRSSSRRARLKKSFRSRPCRDRDYRCPNSTRRTSRRRPLLNGHVPNLTITQGQDTAHRSTSRSAASIQADNNLMTDAPIAVYLDGVYNARMMGASVRSRRPGARRGAARPQARYFGRNTTGGAINIITRKPMDDFHIQQRVGYASTMKSRCARTRHRRNRNTGLKHCWHFRHHSRDGLVRNTLVDDSDGPGSIDFEFRFLRFARRPDGHVHLRVSLDYTTMEIRGSRPSWTGRGAPAGRVFRLVAEFRRCAARHFADAARTISGYNTLPANHDQRFWAIRSPSDYDAADFIH